MQESSSQASHQAQTSASQLCTKRRSWGSLSTAPARYQHAVRAPQNNGPWAGHGMLWPLHSG